MSLTVLLLILAAAALHAGWNYLAKASRDTVTFLWLGVSIGALGYSVYPLFTQSFDLPREVWPYFILSNLAELAYFVTLVLGYRQGDLSLVYPLSRGSPPIFVAFWSALFLGERLPWLGYFGILLMVVGIWVASLAPGGASRVPITERPVPGVGGLQWVRMWMHDHSAALWALASGVFVAVYSLSDKLVVSAMSPLVYNWWVYAGNAVTWFPLVLFIRGRTRIAAELRTNWLRVVAGSVMTIAAYVLVLIAQTMTSASYVVAGRGSSVVIGALLGWLVLGEGVGRVRLWGAVLMFIGLAVMTLAR
ncbi:MAG: DMT family transporter [Anaerolineae bacterium]